MAALEVCVVNVAIVSALVLSEMKLVRFACVSVSLCVCVSVSVKQKI